MTWFEDVFGFRESGYAGTRKMFTLDGETLVTATVPPRRFQPGILTTPGLHELRQAVRELPAPVAGKGLSFRVIRTDAHALHVTPEANGALIQVASQFNLLEMPGPGVTPEHGITGYEHDHTQGPACARACAPATVYRNYLAPVEGQIGQTENCQINTLQDLVNAMGIAGVRMRNGYAMLEPDTVRTIGQYLTNLDDIGRDRLRQHLRIGLHAHTQVTAKGASVGQRVTQAFCSALPVAYNRGTVVADWEPFATLVLEASYEATLLAAVRNHHQTGNPNVFLTSVGGGVFGNPGEWILQALERALTIVRQYPLAVTLVTFRPVSGALQALAARFG